MTEPPNRELSPARIVYGLFAATLVGPFLFRTLARSWLPANPMEFAGYPLVVGVSMVLWLAMAAFSDRAPLLGTRRLSYLLLGGAVGVAGWILAALLPPRGWSWAVVSLMLTLTRESATAAAWGAAADLRRTGGNAPERLAALLIAASDGPGLIRDASKGVLAGHPLSMVAVGGALVAASIVFVTLPALRRADRRPPAADARDGLAVLGRFLGGRTFWVLLLICALTSLADGATTLLDFDRKHRIASSAAVRAEVALASRAAVVAAAGVFALVCRRLAAQRLIPACLFAGAIGLVLLRGAPGTDGPTLVAIVFAQAFGYGLADTAITSLALRAAPEGLEAVGALLPTVAPWTLRNTFLEPALSTGRLGLSFSNAVDTATAAFLLAALISISASRTR